MKDSQRKAIHAKKKTKRQIENYWAKKGLVAPHVIRDNNRITEKKKKLSQRYSKHLNIMLDMGSSKMNTKKYRDAVKAMNEITKKQNELSKKRKSYKNVIVDGRKEKKRIRN